MYYSELVEVYEKLESTTKHLEKTDILVELFKKTNKEDLTKIVNLLQGKVFSDYDERKIGFSSRLMLKAINTATGISINEIEKLWSKIGDLGKVTELLIKKKTQSTLFTKKLTIDKVFINIRKLAELEGIGTVNKKISLVAELLTSAKPNEARFITRTILEELRVGIAAGIIRDAIAKSFNFDVKQVEEDYNLLGDYAEVAELAKENKIGKVSLKPGRPLKLMLSILVKDMEEAFEALGKPAQCFPKGSIIFSNPQPKKIEGIKVGQRVLNSEGIFQNVTEIFKRKYNGTLINITPRFLPEFRVTPEHKILAIKSSECSWKHRKDTVCKPNCQEQKYGCLRNYKNYKTEWLSAYELKERDFLIFPKLKEYSEEKKLDLANYFNANNLEFLNDKIRLCGKYISNSIWVKRYIELNKDFFELCGWYLAEGCLHIKGGWIVFCLGPYEIKEAERLKVLIKNIFCLDAKIKIRPTSLNIVLNSKILMRFFLNSFGKMANKKKIPDFVLTANNELIKEFIRAYINGDGYHSNNCSIITTSSQTIAFQTLLLFSKLNILPSIKVYKNRGKSKENIYRLNIFGERAKDLISNYKDNKYHRCAFWDDEKYFYIPIKRIKKNYYEGEVYNIETEDNTYLAPVIVHNCEFKLDGFRLEIHKQENSREIKLFTRRLEDVTKQFPDIIKYVKENVKGKSFIIDAEAVSYNEKTGKHLPFQNISQRIKRKYNIEEMANKFPIELNVFDIIYYNGKSLMNTTLKDRRELLEKIINQNKGKIVLTKKLVTDDLKKANEFYQESLKNGNEGLMIKNLNSNYKPGRYVNGWGKLKATLENLDLVIVKAEYGEGKRARWLSSYTVACQNKDKLLEVGKVSTGVKEKSGEGVTYTEMTNLLKPLIMKQEGKKVIVKAKIVIEVGYEEIQKSPTYNSGYALRFPRVKRLRIKEKTIADINSIEDLERIYSMQRK